MFELLEVRNFQSIRHLKLELGRLTIITGPSSSGKSALVRALVALASNTRGTRYITQGEKQTSISLSSEDYKVTLERGTTDAYRVTDLNTGKEELFTKMGGAVPERVSEVLRLDPLVHDKSLNFAIQKHVGIPYLLDDSGSEVAKELGELTNVSKILEAVSEANRSRKGIASELKTRDSDLEHHLSRLKEFQGLSDKIRAISAAEQWIAQALTVETDIARLRDVMQNVVVAQSVLDRSVLTEVPDISPVKERYNALTTFKATITEWALAKRGLVEAERNRTSAIEAEVQVKEELHAALVTAGRCPTCGSEIKD